MFQFKTIEKFLSKDECDEILKFSKENLKLKPATVGSNSDINHKSRKSDVAFYNYVQEFPNLYKKIRESIGENVDVKGHEINIEKQPFQFTEYKQGEFYDWHRDSGSDSIFNERYCSLVIQLNDDYEGGNLEIFDNENNKLVFDRGVGNLFIFLSYLKHRVSTIEKGNRYSLVSWFSLIPKEGFKKTLI